MALQWYPTPVDTSSEIDTDTVDSKSSEYDSSLDVFLVVDAAPGIKCVPFSIKCSLSIPCLKWINDLHIVKFCYPCQIQKLSFPPKFNFWGVFSTKNPRKRYEGRMNKKDRNWKPLILGISKKATVMLVTSFECWCPKSGYKKEPKIKCNLCKLRPLWTWKIDQNFSRIIVTYSVLDEFFDFSTKLLP